ncbi:MAG TPA: ABC transporter permease subunit [Solirubrobacteraceae bacterium]|nr:ABC transporter permease subunit [Solirubrobacteraceae bacterium]
MSPPPPADTLAAPLGAPPPGSTSRAHAGLRVRGAGGALGLGLSTLYLSIFVLIPVAAVVDVALGSGWHAFWTSFTNTVALTALEQTLAISAVVAAVGSVLGTVVAWVLVRDQFGGKQILNSVIDLPFALPTIVASLALLGLYGTSSPVGIDIALTKTIVGVALLFVTLPFAVRSVQPVLLELDQEVEEAAASLGAANATTFRRIVLPALRPAILSGTALSFARCMGEYGSIVLLAGKVQIASLVIFADVESATGSGNSAYQPAAGLSVALLAIALAVLFGLRKWGTDGDG